MKLSPHFTLQEMTATSYPQLQDSPTLEVIVNLTFLCCMVLEPLRERWGQPLLINSGYRSAKLNAHVGGVSNSYHLKGLAADIRCSCAEEAIAMRNHCRGLANVDLALVERKNGSFWLHVQTTKEKPPRRLLK